MRDGGSKSICTETAQGQEEHAAKLNCCVCQKIELFFFKIRKTKKLVIKQIKKKELKSRENNDKI